MIDFNEGKCFQELPVRIRQEDGTLSANLSFVDPVTHVIEPVGTEAPCSSTMPQYYKLDGEWYHNTGSGIVPAIAPKQFSPNATSEDILTHRDKDFHWIMGQFYWLSGAEKSRGPEGPVHPSIFMSSYERRPNQVPPPDPGEDTTMPPKDEM